MADPRAPGFLDALPDEAPARKNAEAKQLDRLRQREDRILEKSLAAVEDVLAARDIDDNHTDEIPKEWIAEVGMEEAAKRLRVAKDARRNKKEAPVYLEHARATAIGIIKARSSEPKEAAEMRVMFTLVAPAAARRSLAALEGQALIEEAAAEPESPVIDVDYEEIEQE